MNVGSFAVSFTSSVIPVRVLTSRSSQLSYLTSGLLQTYKLCMVFLGVLKVISHCTARDKAESACERVSNLKWMCYRAATEKRAMQRAII